VKEDLVRKLLDFGLTVNQAKVYLNTMQSGTTCAGVISERTGLHRQDIYKVLPKLEKKGLIIKVIGKPLMIKATPVEKALNTLVLAEREKSNARISRLITSAKEIVNATRKQPISDWTLKEAQFTLLNTDRQIENMADLSFENAKNECDWVSDMELLTKRTRSIHDYFGALSMKGVRLRAIIETLNNKDFVKRAIEKIRPNRGNFKAKLVCKERSTPYMIIDNKELWIRRKKTTESGMPAVLWTNSINMIDFYRANFEDTWNDTDRSVYIHDIAREEPTVA
jgi:sugar-specific transcriptional regulator TrmB